MRRSATQPPGGPSRPGATYVQDMLQTLWPGSARVFLSRRGRRPDGTIGYVVVPNVREPRLLVPLGPRRVAAGALKNYKAGSSLYQRARLAALAAGARLGLLSVLPDRFWITTSTAEGCPDIEKYLTRSLGHAVRLAFYIGPVRAVQKPVIQLLDDRGATTAFAKVGVNAFTRSLVRREAETLSSLAQRNWNRLVLPRVVHHGSWRGHEVLVQQALRPRLRPANASTLLSEAMVELATCGGRRREALATSSYWRGLMSRLRYLPAEGCGGELLATALEVEQRCGKVVLDFGAWHGDWAPWNMGFADEGVLLWDWEGYEFGRSARSRRDPSPCADRGRARRGGTG